MSKQIIRIPKSTEYPLVGKVISMSAVIIINSILRKQKNISFAYAGWINSGDQMCSMVTIVNSTLWYFWNLLRE